AREGRLVADQRHELARELRVDERVVGRPAVEVGHDRLVPALLGRPQAERHLVDLVRPGAEAHLHEGEDEERRARPRLRRLEHSGMRDLARLRAEPALLPNEVEQPPLVDFRHPPLDLDHSGSLSWNQKYPRGASVRRYGSSPIAGKRELPKSSTGIRPRNADRSSSTACAERATLWTQRTTSSSQ